MQVRVPGMQAAVVMDLLNKAAEDVGVRINEPRVYGTRVQFTLRPPRGKANQWQRTSASGFYPSRKVAAICWHGHRAFFRKMYEMNTSCIFRIGWLHGKTAYTSSEQFERTHSDTGTVNIGSIMYPIAACDACICPESGEY